MTAGAPTPRRSGLLTWLLSWIYFAERVGQPRGLDVLFFTEMWERFSYYGMRGFLILYLTAAVTGGGLGFDDRHAAHVYALYVSSVWLTPILGGFIADRLLGQYRSVLAGGTVIALGHFTLAFKALGSFYAGLVLIVLGTGLLKPNVSTLVGSLYDQSDQRRDAGFSLFYMGINVGAFLGITAAGALAQKVDWHLGFAAAGVGMTCGLIQYVLGKRRLQPALDRLAAPPPSAGAPLTPAPSRIRLSAVEGKRIAAVFVLFIFAALFWGAYEQAGSTLNLFADRYTRLGVFGFTVPSSWLQSVQPIFVILLAPVMAWLWVRLGPREPSSPAKFALALLCAGVAFLLLVPAAAIAQSGAGVKVSPLWLIVAYFIEELGELCLSPVGLSAVTKLAPPRLVGRLMGVFFLSNWLGNLLAGWTAGFFTSLPLGTLFATVAGVCLAAALAMFLLIKPVQNLMGGVH
ncbi:MAG TPA: peptide MFS transporter [Gemmatimonadales bacterium]|nr:peptide MFS transporter [Gemmatimonadales bacterium]